MTGYKEESLFFVPVPDLTKICSVLMSFHSFSCERDEGELRSRQVKTCRELLSLHSDIVACPVLGSCGGITVIMAMTFFKNGIIQAFAQRHNLQISSPQRVPPSILQMCLSYSLTARMAPNWNRAGLYLIAGKDFLSDAGKRIAVVMELNVNETEVCVSVEARTIRLPPATLKDFAVPALVMEKFLSTRDSVLHTRPPNNWCYILPSMKKGQVISISRAMPQECPFLSYTELQNHWRSMYGYHLPPLNEDDVVYCSVYFKPLGEKLFTYPLSCIRIQPVQCFPRVNLQGALGAFLSDVRSLIENVCGFEVQMTTKPCYHTTNLGRPSLQVSRAPPANLTTKSSSRLLLTQLPSVIPPERVPLSQLAPVQRPLSQPVDLSSIRQELTIRRHMNTQIPSHIVHPSQRHCSDTHQFSSSFTSLTSFASSFPHSNSQSAPQAPKLVPIFKNKLLSHHNNLTKILVEKKKQAEARTLCPSGLVVNSTPFASCSPPYSSSPPNCPPETSHPPIARVSLPFFNGHKRKRSVFPTQAEQPLSLTQPAAMPEIIRKRAGEVFECHPKKPKVNVQDVDVVKYARNNQLAKINVATLQIWLKCQGITICSKDKKEDLMLKVMQCLSEP